MNKRKKETMSVGEEAAEAYFVACKDKYYHEAVIEHRQKLASIIDRIVAERGLGGETPDSVGNCESTETDYPPPVTEREVEQFLREYYAGKHPLPQAFKDALKKAEPEFKARLAAIYSEHRVPLISTASQTATATPSRGAQKRWTAETVMAIAKSGAAFEACERISQVHNATLPVPGHSEKTKSVLVEKTKTRVSTFLSREE